MRDQDVVDILYQGLTILNTLLENAGRPVSRRDLAAKTGLAPKQVGRYLNTLEDLFPLQRRQLGRENMVMMPRTALQRLRLLPFTIPELLALSFYTSLSSYVHDTTPLGHLHTACEKIATFLGQDFSTPTVCSGRRFWRVRSTINCMAHRRPTLSSPPSLRPSWSPRSAISHTKPPGQQRPGATGFIPIRSASTTGGSICLPTAPSRRPSWY